jgi:hypothetical protein
MKVFDNILITASLVPATRTADANGTGVDTKGFNDAMLVVTVGDLDLASGDETYVVNLEESDASGSGFAAVSGYSITLTADNDCKELRIPNLNTTRKRYLRAVLDVGGTTPSAPIAAFFVLGEPFSGPVGNA